MVTLHMTPENETMPPYKCFRVYKGYSRLFTGLQIVKQLKIAAICKMLEIHVIYSRNPVIYSENWIIYSENWIICIIKDWPKWLFYTWVGHSKRPEREARRSFTVANPGVKKPFWPVFCSISRVLSLIYCSVNCKKVKNHGYFVIYCVKIGFLTNYERISSSFMLRIGPTILYDMIVWAVATWPFSSWLSFPLMEEIMKESEEGGAGGHTTQFSLGQQLGHVIVVRVCHLDLQHSLHLSLEPSAGNSVELNSRISVTRSEINIYNVRFPFSVRYKCRNKNTVLIMI